MLRILLIAILLYLILRAVARLWRAMQIKQGQGGSGHSAGHLPGDERATKDRFEEDIEDARWKDL